MTPPVNLGGRTPGPWRACKDGLCSCGQIWSISEDRPVAFVQRDGEWGDEWHEVVDGQVQRQFSAYGSVPEGSQAANAAFIVHACNLHDELVEALKGLVDTFGSPEAGEVDRRLAISDARAILTRTQEKGNG
jgi:hypothetical protein